jgi:acetoin:2,6-dichlorophenolindophenol oxidoreductase subunit beta
MRKAGRRWHGSLRIATSDSPIPYSPPLEDAFLPGADRIAREVLART